MLLYAFLGRWFGSDAWGLKRLRLPWGERPSLYGHVRAHIAAGELGLVAGGVELPDDQRSAATGGLRWAPGALDGAFGHHGGGGQAEETAQAVLGHILNLLSEATQEELDALYELLLQQPALEFVDPLLQGLVQLNGLNVSRLHELAFWLTTRAADREPVKVGLALLGALRGFDDLPVFLALGRHDEFTLYAAVAIKAMLQDPDATLWELARHTRGWGRVQAVERISEEAGAEIREWLVREGYRNDVMIEYLAHTCAATGRLQEQLAASEIDPELLLGATEILLALLEDEGGPGEGIDEYEHAGIAVEHFLRHARSGAAGLAQLICVTSIRDYLLDDAADWSERAQRGFTPERRPALLAAADAIRSQPGWEARVRAGLRSEDEGAFATAARAAEVLGLDVWEQHFERLEHGGSHWYHVMHTGDRERAARVVALAEQRLPLAAIASGPAEETGLGPEFEPHRDLDFVLQGLGSFPGLGWPLVRAALASPIVRNRHLALDVLGAWGRDAWPPEVADALRSAHAAEPHDDLRAALGRLAPAPEDQDD